MDQSISCQDIYYIYKHPLSILIHLKFQDKDGCSKNGSRELLFRIGSSFQTRAEIMNSIMDSRGVPIHLEYNRVSCYDSDDERTIFGFKQLNLTRTHLGM